MTDASAFRSLPSRLAARLFSALATAHWPLLIGGLIFGVIVLAAIIGRS